MRRNPFLDFLAAVVPAAEREELVRRYGAEPFVWSAILGVLEFYLGGRLLLKNAIAYFQTVTDALAAQVLELDPRHLNSFENRVGIFWSGSFVWLSWLLAPLTWLLLSIPLVGIARLVAFGVNHDAVGEPTVWVVVRAAQALRGWIGRLQRRRRFGPLRPDRVLRGRNGALVVLSCRPKPDWNERITIEIGERFYRLQRIEERRDGAWWAHAHLLQEAHPNEIFRGLIRYAPPR
ncbi:MAG TPA: hypothetical protein VGX68_16775 [Thermoanaerobaculia bacterium]|jgi:hypothetical protein|nr:hypothetical protein [Thermoanaerobaculia bacterium]